MLYNIDSVSFSYGGNLIFENVSFAINEGERIGLIGANGEGKTTLIKLISGELTPDSGSITKKNGVTLGYLEQNGGYESGNTVYAEMRRIFKEELDAIDRLSDLCEKLQKAENSHEYAVLSAKIESLNKYLSAKDCFDIDVKIKTVLNGMGFLGMYDRVIDSMSGGEKTRLKFARLLLESPDILILDEPTNHLDISTLYWLEEYLQSYKGAIFVVSHDRYFLDKIVNRILEIENYKLMSFSGNYSKYKILKSELNARRQKEYEAQVEERAKLQDYVARNIVRATTAKSAQSRVKQLEKMELLEKPYIPPKPPRFEFKYDISPYENVLEITHLNLKAGDKNLVNDCNLNVKRGQKLALIGENGTGKTTLLKKILRGEERAIKVGRYVKFGYYDQESANLDGENTVLYELWGRHTGYTQTEARSALAACGLFAEDMEKPVKALSGGERAKLALCVLEGERGNVLLLDEPTNHLDLPAREGLEKGLKEFDGTLIFVSHDRYFLSEIATAVAEIEDGKLTVFEGTYGEYIAEKSKLSKPEKEKAETKKTGGYRSRKERADEEQRKSAILKMEKEISECEKREEEINNLLAKPETASDYVKVNELLKELENLKNQLDRLYNEYGKVI